MKKTKLDNTGERMIPEHHKGKNIYGAHLARYQVASGLVKDKVVLDIACGSGYGTKLLSKNAKDVIGVDIDADTVQYAKENFFSKNIEYKTGNGEDIPLKDSTVDVIVSFETIEHISDQNRFLSEIKRVLKPGGILLLSTPNDEEYVDDNEFHLREFNYLELENIVSRFFKHHMNYFQTVWLYSSIFSGDMQKKEWEQPIITIKTLDLKPKQCMYFLTVCSDEPIAQKVQPIGVIGEHYRLIEVQKTGEAINQVVQEHVANTQRVVMHADNLKKEIEELKSEITRIENSASWKFTKILRKTKLLAKKIIKK